MSWKEEFCVVLLLLIARKGWSEQEVLLEKPDSTQQWHWRVFKTVGSGFTDPTSIKHYYAVCDVGNFNTQPKNWLLVDFVETQDAKRVFIEVEYTMRKCPAGATYCKPEFYLYYHHTDQKDDKTNPTKGQFTRLATVSPLQVIEDKEYTFNSSIAVTKKLIYFAFLDTGACFVLKRVNISYKFCPGESQGRLVRFPKTIAPFNDLHPAYADGKCSVKNSKNKTRLLAACTSSGQWNISQNSDCFCMAGYGFEVNKCEECPRGQFKSDVENSACQPCPDKSVSSSKRKACNCIGDYYRSPGDSSKPCQALPAAVKGLKVVSSNSTSITLHWNSDKKDGIWYEVDCLWCEEEDCGSNLKKQCQYAAYSPSKMFIKVNKVTVSGLETSNTYQFKVYSVSKLNEFEKDKTKWKFETVTGRTVSVTEPTGEPGTGLKGTLRIIVYYVIPIAAAMLIIFVVILVCVCRRKRSKDGYVPPGEFEMNGRIRLASRGQRTYVDPSIYDNPEDALKTFGKELDPKFVRLDKVIGGGEFGNVYKGILTRPDEEPIAVAVKTLKTGYTHKSRQDFLSEASIMGQFCDPNVIFLEGIVTKHPQLMIVIEFMANGSLESFLKNKDSQLTIQQLLGMSRGVASGMRYLSEMNFVHRDLAARNVLVTETLVCKVADFGLSRELDDSAYETQGGKIPVRWTALEAIEYRKFTSASDVWSYGIVVWEIMSFGQRPYWDWGNFQVMDRIRDGYRLPAPMDCPKIIHDIMLDCWNEKPNKRPKFQEIVKKLDLLIRSPDKLNDNLPMTQRLSTIEYSDATSVQDWLESIKMERYAEKFREAGYERLNDVVRLEEGDLKGMGITLIGHKNKIRKSIREVGKKIARDSVQV